MSKTSVVAKADAADVLARVMGQDYAQAYLGEIGFETVRADREKIRRERMAEAARVAAAAREKTRRANGGAVASRKARREAGLIKPQKRLDRGRMVELYRSGVSLAEIGRTVGAHRSSVTRVLQEELGSLYKSPAKQKQDVCKRGHDMSVHGKPIKAGGRYCSECKRMRERVGGKNV